MSSDRLLVWLKPNYLGDAVMATPLLDGLIDLGLRPAVMVGGAVKQVLLDRAEQVDFIDAENLSNPLKLLRQAIQLKALRIGTALLVNRSFRSALAARLAGIPHRIGHATEGRGWLLTESLSYPKDKFEAECYLDLAKAAGLNVPSAKPKLMVTPEEKSDAMKLLGEAIVGVQPGARYASKQIPIAVLSKVVNALQGQGHSVAMFGGKEESVHGEELRRLVGPQLVNLIGITSLRQTVGCLSCIRLMIGSDTGVMHLAAGVGCPTVTVFGPNPIEKWGHNYPPHKPLLAPDGQISRIDSQTILAASNSVLQAGVRAD